MKLLFLDDDPIRHHKFFQSRKESGVTIDWAKTAKEAIALLEANAYDEAHLDHDLEEGHYADQETSTAKAETSGQMVALHIGVMDKAPKLVVIHSWNKVGALKMAAYLYGKTKIVIEPFGMEELALR